MKKHITPWYLSILLILGILFVGFGRPASSIISGLAENGSSQPALAASSETTFTYLPLVNTSFPLKTVFGIQMAAKYPHKGFDQVVDAKTSWVRYNGVIWSAIEPNKGDRLWEEADWLEPELIAAANAGMQAVVTIRRTPTWAQQIAGSTCGRIKVDELDAFAEFVYDVVDRYHQPPYNVQYWEIWNEPDVLYTDALADEPFGCWGDPNDTYYGGGYYADVLKVVYPAMKAADPNAQMLIGGLLLDCDPRLPENYCMAEGRDDTPPRYLEGILLNGGADYFDGISFHAYDYFPYWEPQLGSFYNPNWGSYWNITGPVSSAKADFLKEVLAQYNVTGKYLINAEAALICGATNDPPGIEGCEPDDSSTYEQTKARYVTQAYTAAMKDGLASNIWFDIIGWRNSALINEDLTLRPAMYAYEFARLELRDAAYVREVSSYSNVRIYEFQHASRQIWVMWSLDGANHNIQLPGTPLEVHDFMGMEIAPSSSLTVTLDPLFLDWTR